MQFIVRVQVHGHKLCEFKLPWPNNPGIEQQLGPCMDVVQAAAYALSLQNSTFANQNFGRCIKNIFFIPKICCLLLIECKSKGAMGALLHKKACVGE